MEDQILICIQCESEFAFTPDEQKRYERMGFDEPHRCPQCRKHKSKKEDQTVRIRQKDKKKHYRMKYEDDDFEGYRHFR